MARVLVIDDNAEARRFLAKTLERAGHEFALAADGEEGLRKSEEERFNLVLLDVRTPKVAGIAVLKDLQAKRPGLPVIMIFEGSDSEPLEYTTALADTYGASRVLFKPFLREELLAAVEEALRPRAKQDRTP